MSRKISDYFKVQQSKREVEVKEEKEVDFKISFNELKDESSKIKIEDVKGITDSKEEERSEIRDCFVHLKDINEQFNGKLKLFDEIPNIKESERFVCDFDGKTFKTKKQIYNHMKIHFLLIECEVCHKMLKFNCIKNHLNNVHGSDKKSAKCKICSKTFKSFRYLKSHEKNHNKKFECEICNKMFPCNRRLNEHKRSYHENKRNFECEICGKKFNYKSYLKFHQKSHDKNRQKPYKCQRCDYATDIQQNFNSHEKFHKSQDKKYAAMKNPLKCQECPTLHRNQNFLNLHMKNVHPKVLFQCDLCAKFIKVKWALMNHMNVHIPKIKNDPKIVGYEKVKNVFNCYVCNQKFSKYSCLNSHIKIKHPDGQIEQFECDFDGKTFKSKELIYAHMKGHLPSIKCEICNKILKTFSMNAHLKQIHSTDKKFYCNICGKFCKSLKLLNSHLSSHNKKFKCEICNNKFGSNGQLKEHKKYIHENAFSFECEICGKKFSRPHHLKYHRKTHEKDRPKPLKCQRCEFETDNKQTFKKHQRFHERKDKKYSEMKNPLKCEKCQTFHHDELFLRKHMRSVHPKVLLQCDLCGRFIKTKYDLTKHMKFHISKQTKNLP